jgi:hypothetical protein
MPEAINLSEIAITTIERLHDRIAKLKLEALEHEIRVGRLLEVLKEHDLLEEVLDW